MGAAAVFETAAETPPTDKGLATAVQMRFVARWSHQVGLPMAILRDGSTVMKRTQEVDHEALRES
jgi:hypothetical protein